MSRSLVPTALLRISALFLGGAGTVQLGLELLAHFGGIGPYAEIFGGSPYTIGFAEAHALSVLLAIIFWRSASPPARRVVLTAGVTHAILALANLAFWSSFATFGLELPGAVATVLHIGLGLAHFAAAGFAGAGAGDLAFEPTADLGFRLVASALFIAGMYLHITHILIGRELFLTHVLRPEVEWTLTATMVYALATGLAVRNRALLASRWRAVYYVMLAYFGVSVAIHLRAVAAGDSTYVTAFPEWYSYVVLGIMVAFLVFVRRLRFASSERLGAAVTTPGP